MAGEVVKLSDLGADEVPEVLRTEAYFDFEAHPFAHEALFRRDGCQSAFGVIGAIGDYAREWLGQALQAKRGESGVTVLTDSAGSGGAQTIGCFDVILGEGAVFEPTSVVGSAEGGERHAICIEAGARVVGGAIYLDEGCVYIGSGTVVEAGVGIKGPTIIGKDCEIRQGAYLRGSCVLGDGCTIRGELKNVVMMDKANFPHPSYVGDSLCGYMTHFGNQATTANLGIYEGVRDKEKRKPLILAVDGVGYNLGSPKMGICMGDFSQLGCNSVTDPGTFLRPYTIAYALTRLSKGFYGPNEVLKNKPMEHGVIERVPLEPLE